MADSNYENAPATIMLATHCAACGRPLVDAVSVEAAMGPDCREKYGVLDTEVVDRAAVNAIVHRIALSQRATLADVTALAALGAHRIVAKLAARFAVVTVTQDGTDLVVDARYDDRIVAAMRTVPGRRWDAVNKVNRVPLTSARALAAAFARFPPGFGMGRKGPFATGPA